MVTIWGMRTAFLVEERAVGVPLIGSVADQVRGHPVGLPMNLFALHPSGAWLAKGFENPSLTALRVMERCFEMGWLAGDLGPRNVFYAPESGEATVIDLGNLRRSSPATARRAAFDVNDTLFEFFQFYATPDAAPESADAFAAVSERRLSGSLERMAEGLARSYAGAVKAQGDAARGILERIGRRGYVEVGRVSGGFLWSICRRFLRRRTRYGWRRRRGCGGIIGGGFWFDGEGVRCEGAKGDKDFWG